MMRHSPQGHSGPQRGTRVWWRGSKAELPEPSGNADSKGERPGKDGIRKDLVARVKAEIAAGTYDTPEKWELLSTMLLDRLMSD
ncbi:MAG: hypothetical protein U0744_18555 [Gemmataceae bacterium]